MGQTINSPFSRPKDRKKSVGVPAGSEFYIDKDIYLEFVQTGIDENGKALGSIQPVVHEKQKSIREVINANADKVGLKNILVRFSNTGDDSFVNYKTPLPNGDYSEIPNKTPEEIYASLPKELTKGLSMDEFLKAFNSDMFSKFLDSIKERESDEKNSHEEKEKENE